MPSSAVGLDLYQAEADSDSLVFYRGAEYPLALNDLVRLQERGIHRLFIQKESKGRYQKYLRQLASAPTDDPRRPMVARLGALDSVVGDERSNIRMRIRTHAALHYETTLPSVPRGAETVGVYIGDFSRRGCGLISPVQMYPEETVRVVLATFWIRLKVVRSRRVGPSCYEVGGELTQRNQPSPEAFDGIALCSSAI